MSMSRTGRAFASRMHRVLGPSPWWCWPTLMVLHHHEGPSTLLIRNANVNALLVLDILITHSPEFHVQVGGREEAEVEQDGNFIDGLAGTDAYATGI